MSQQEDVLLLLCEQACQDEEWLAALKVLFWYMSSFQNHSCPTSFIEKKAQFLAVVILNHLQEDVQFHLEPNTEEYGILEEFQSRFSNNADILISLANVYFSYDLYVDALSISQEAVVLDPYDAIALETFENICCHSIDRWHFLMLNDKSRNKAYEATLHKILSRRHRQTNVLDVGSGTGILSFLASKWSNNVFSVETSAPMCQLAKLTMETIKLGREIMDKITIINKMSLDLVIPMDIPTKVDVLVTEIFDAGFFGEGIISTLAHAWRRLMKTDTPSKSVVIPEGATIFLAGIESEDLRNESHVTNLSGMLKTGDLHIASIVGFLDSDPYTCVRLSKLPRGYKYLISTTQLMAVNCNDPQAILKLSEGVSGSLTLEVIQEGILDALTVCFNLSLTDSINISTQAESDSCWEQAVFPISHVRLKNIPANRISEYMDPSGLKVYPGDRVTVEYSLKDDKLSMCVTEIACPQIQSVGTSMTTEFPLPNEMFEHSLSWCPHNVYCLNDWELRTLNDSVYWSQLIDLLKLNTATGSAITAQFLHINHGFSPLSLYALMLGYNQVNALAVDDSHKALLWKLVQINQLDIHKIKALDDLSEIEVSEKVPRNDMTSTLTNDCTEAAVSRLDVVLDMVDQTGRLVENWSDTWETVLNYVSQFDVVNISPLSVDIWGVLIDSDTLLKQNRVVCDENVLHYPVKEHVNKYSTKNHPDFHFVTLEHKKLTAPFKICSLNLLEEINRSRTSNADPNPNQSETNESQRIDSNSNTVQEDQPSMTKQSTSCKVETTSDGKVCAMVYWFDLHLSPSVSLNTSDPSYHWHQAAIMFDDKNMAQVKTGEQHHLKFHVYNSMIFVSMGDDSDCVDGKNVVK